MLTATGFWLDDTSRPSPVARCAPPALEVEVGGRPLPVEEVLYLDALQAVDRPDRLDLAFRGSPSAGVGAGAAGPGEHLVVRIQGQRVFDGRVQRADWRADATHGRHHALTAYAGYHFLRDGVPAGEKSYDRNSPQGSSRPCERYAQMTDSEVARRIAAALDLVAVVEPTLEVTPVLERRGDPLRFLRRLADARGAELAITRGRLFFAPEVAPLAHVVFSPSTGVHGESFAGAPAELSIERVLGAGAVGRKGRLTVSGNASLRPLISCTLAEVDATVDGRYRVVRCHHRMRATTYSTEVRFLEHGWNLACHEKGGRT